MFSLGVQRQVATSVVAQVQYVGSRGWDQSDDRAINTLPWNDFADRALVVAGQKNANLARIFPGYSSITVEENESNFAYNSFQAGVRMENRHGLTVQLAYTWSHEIDEVSNDLNAVSNPFDLSYDRGSGALDRRHIFNANYVYAIPFFNKSDNKFLQKTLGGWEFSGVTVAQSGTPINIRYTGADVLGLGGGVTNRENVIGPIGLPHTVNAWFTKSSFGDPAPLTFGNARKDAVVGPGLFNFNLALFKNIILTSREEGPRLQLRFESFNTFNHTEFNGIDTGSADGNFGKVTSTYDPRVLQLGAKFSF